MSVTSKFPSWRQCCPANYLCVRNCHLFFGCSHSSSVTLYTALSVRHLPITPSSLLPFIMEAMQFVEDLTLDGFYSASHCHCENCCIRPVGITSTLSATSLAPSAKGNPRQLLTSSFYPTTSTSTLPMALARASRPCSSPKTASTSTKSPYLRWPSSKPSTVPASSSPSLPRFSLTMHSLLLFSCLFYVTVPTVTSASSPLTGLINRRSLGDPASSLASLSASPSSFNVRRSPPTQEQNSNNFFGPVISDAVESDEDRTMKCAYYNRTQCETTNVGCGKEYQICHPNEGNERTSLCYALWRNSTEKGIEIEFKGCWLGHSKDCVPKDSSETHQSDHCVQTQTPMRNKKQLFFCCCTGAKCNKNVKHLPLPAEPVPTPADQLAGSNSSGSKREAQNYLFFYLLFGLAVFFLTGVVSVAVFLFGRCRNKPNGGDPTATHEPLLDNSNFNGIIGYVGLNPIKLKEIRAQGKFGSVWQATDGRDNMVAVKVFTMQDRNSWQTEKDVFMLPQMKHNNILNYLGAERHGEGLDVEYWLITEYHPNGSLWDYLKSHTVNIKQLLTIIQGIGAGLTHLHEEMNASSTERAKPSIAHRDFKSKNVLISSNFRACIADFGLAIVFHPNAILGDAHGQVGTRRYMAPEVLEGAINFNRESFLRIDMYACGLVLWELMSRTNSGEITCSEYRLPFEEEVGTHPTLEDMQMVVSQEKKRPKLLETWWKHPVMSVVANTVQDCWDQDTEARISASTICERIQALILNEDNCLSLNNQNGSVTYRAAFPSVASATASMPPASTGNTKNTFHLAAQPTTGPLPSLNGSVTSNGGSLGFLRETST